MSNVKVQTLRDQLALAHQVLEDTMKEISVQQAHWQPAGQAHSVAANYTHIVVQEDVIINFLLKGENPFFATRFADTTGITEIPPLPSTELVNWQDWAKRVKVDLSKIKTYSQSVYANTDTYLASLHDEDLEHKVDTRFLGVMTRFQILNLTVLSNCNWHTGEISAVKGLLDLTGYPF